MKELNNTLAQGVIILITETDLAHMSVPHHKTTVVVPHDTDVVPLRPRATAIAIIIIIVIVAIAAVVEMINITAHHDIVIIDIIPLLTGTTIIITMAAVIIITIIKIIMTTLLVIGENLKPISFCNNTIHLLMPF